MLCVSGFELYSRWVPLRNLCLQDGLGDKQIRDCLVPRHSRSLLWGYYPFTTPGHALPLSPAPRIKVQTLCVAQYNYETLLMITGDYSSVAKLSLISQSINQSTSQSVHQSVNQSIHPSLPGVANVHASWRVSKNVHEMVNRKCCETVFKNGRLFLVLTGDFLSTFNEIFRQCLGDKCLPSFTISLVIIKSRIKRDR